MSEVSPGNILPGFPLIHSPIITPNDGEEIFGRFRVAAESMRTRGYAIISLDKDRISRLSRDIRNALASDFDLNGWRANEDAGLRIQDGWRKHESIRELALLPEIIELLTVVYGRRPIPFQTLNFPVGTQQHIHSDAVHFHSEPAGFMCGVWVALEDIHPDAGPLEYLPGSHSLPFLQLRDIGYTADLDKNITQEVFHPVWQSMVRNAGFQRETFLPRSGEALIWTSNLLHGGSKVNNRNLTRWSQVTHYFFEGCLYYTPLLSNWPAGPIAWRAPYDIETGKRVIPPVHLNSEVDLIQRLANFNPKRYLEANPDVKASGINPYLHLINYGLRENRKW
jgi:hypothetical protein